MPEIIFVNDKLKRQKLFVLSQINDQAASFLGVLRKADVTRMRLQNLLTTPQVHLPLCVGGGYVIILFVCGMVYSLFVKIILPEINIGSGYKHCAYFLQ